MRILATVLLALLNVARVDQIRFKVAVLSYGQETSTFYPGGDVTVDDWTRSI